MSHIIIEPAIASTDVHVTLAEQQREKGEAFLLGKSGEELQRFALSPGVNRLHLKGYQEGIYSLRVETAKEVYTRQFQIQLPAVST